MRFVLDPHGPIEIRLARFSVAINNDFKTLKTVKKRQYVCMQCSGISKKKALLLEGTKALPVCSSGKSNT